MSSVLSVTIQRAPGGSWSAPWGFSEPSEGALGPAWGCVGDTLRPIGGPFGGFLGPLGASLSHRDDKKRKTAKPCIFCVCVFSRLSPAGPLRGVSESLLERGGGSLVACFLVCAPPALGRTVAGLIQGEINNVNVRMFCLIRPSVFPFMYCFRVVYSKKQRCKIFDC